MADAWRGIALISGALLLLAPLARSEASTDENDLIESIGSQSLFFETFDSQTWQSQWKHSRDAKYNGQFTTHAAAGWTNKGLKVPEKNKYYGLTALLRNPVDPVVASTPEPLPLVVQYEVKYEAGVTCGGSYLKLLTADADLEPEGLVDSTPYSIMFGPDRCGAANKVHLILRHRNPVSGIISEKHLASPPSPESNDYTHIYTLKLFPDHGFEVLVDGAVKASGSLLDGAVMQPPLLPPSEIPDPDDKKPADWVDLKVIPDPDAAKPDDWDDREKIEDAKAVKPKGWQEDELELINDPAAKRPADWDEEEDGVWEPNQIRNPKCKVGCGPWKPPMKANPAFKGAWKPPMIDNPEYKGEWVQKRVPNPDYFEDNEPIRSGVAPIGAVALELWTIDSGYMFDNILITRDPAVAELALSKLWKPRHDAEVKSFEAQLKANEEKEKEKEKERKKAEESKKEKKSRKGGRHGSEQLEEFTAGVLSMFEDGAVLAPLAPYMAPLLDYLREHPQGIILVVGLTPMLLLAVFVLVRATSGNKKSTQSGDAAAGEKETDALLPDDDDVGEVVPAAGEEVGEKPRDGAEDGATDEQEEITAT